MRGHFERRTYTNRKNGEEMATSTWTVVYDEPREPGSPRRQRTRGGFKTRKEAEIWLHGEAERLRYGVTSGDDRQPLAQYLRAWLAMMEAVISPTAFHSYENHVLRHIIPAIGKVKLCDLGPHHIEKAKAIWASTQHGIVKQSRPLSPRTAKHVFTTLRNALNRAKRQRIIASNPCEFVDPPRVERKEMQSLDATGGAALMAALEEDAIGAAVVVAIGTGLRRGELLALRWGDVDLDARVLLVARSIERYKGETRFKDPKTKRSRRTLSIPGFVVERLRRHRREQAQRFLSYGFGRPTDETLIFEQLGEPWVPNTFGVAFTRALRRANIPPLRLHDLRHSYASIMLASGVDLKTVSDSLGHSTISTTADVYAHVTESLKREGAEKLDAAFSAERRRARG